MLRPLTEDDARAVNDAVTESLDHLRPWMPWASAPPPTEAWRRDWIRERNEGVAAGGERVRGIFVGETVVGVAGLRRGREPGVLEIGYWVHVAWTRRGIATAAVAQLIALAFADPAITSVEIHHDVANAASGAVAAKAGFTPIGDVARERQAPAETGTERRWRLTLAEHTAKCVRNVTQQSLVEADSEGSSSLDSSPQEMT